MTDFPHTHVVVDGRLHRISRVEEHLDGPSHTHRAHLGCGVSVDLDLNGERHAKLALEHEEIARQAASRGDEGLRSNAAQRASTARQRADHHRRDHSDESSRWRRHAGLAADCPTCAGVELGHSPVVHPLGHSKPNTVQADQFTGVRCPSCAGEIRKRRADGVFACTGSGHEFSATELIAQTSSAFKTLLDLAKE